MVEDREGEWTRGMYRCQRERGKPLEKVLRQLFNQHGTWNQVARELGVQKHTLRAWRRRLGLVSERITVLK